MDINVLYSLLTSRYTIILFASFIGAMLGELSRDLADGEIQSLLKFIVELISSTIIGTAISIMASIIFKTESYMFIVCTGAILGFVGHKKALDYFPGLKSKK